MNRMLPIIESLDIIWECLLRASLSAAIVIPLAWIACRLLAHVPRRLSCWIWRLAFIKVIFAAIWIAPISIPLLPASGSSSTIAANAVSPQINTVEGWNGTLNSPLLNEYASVPIGWSHLLVMAWIIGTGYLITRSLQEWWQSVQIRRDGCDNLPQELTELYHSSADAIGISRPPRLLQSKKTDVPALVGIFNPVVIIPSGLSERMKTSELSLVLRHEIGHQKRLDLHWNLLARFIEVLLFFHPMIWLARRRWRIAQEAACDELVLQTPDVHPRTYANALIQVLELVRHNQRKSYSMVQVVSSFRGLRERILTMQTSATWSQARWVAATCSMLVVSLIGVIPWKLTPLANEVRFINGDFHSGDKTGWTISPGDNAVFSYEDVAPFDILGKGTESISDALTFSVGQATSEPKVYRHIDVTQQLHLTSGKTYSVGFDWAVQNFFSIDNFHGGKFELIVDGNAIASFDTENILTETVERGTLSSNFVAKQTGNHTIGARISRRFPIPFPTSKDPVLLQYLDNFRIQAIADPDP